MPDAVEDMKCVMVAYLIMDIMKIAMMQFYITSLKEFPIIYNCGVLV